MSQVPIFSNVNGVEGMGMPNSEAAQAKYGRGGLYSQFVGKDLLHVLPVHSTLASCCFRNPVRT